MPFWVLLWTTSLLFASLIYLTEGTGAGIGGAVITRASYGIPLKHIKSYGGSAATENDQVSRRQPSPLKWGDQIRKRQVTCNDLFGQPDSSDCARALYDMPNPSPAEDVDIQFVSNNVDAPIGSPIFQLPKFYARGNCRIAVMNFDQGNGQRIEDLAKWGAIRGAIGRVMVNCVPPPLLKGGTEKTGQNGRVVVYVYAERSIFYRRIERMTFGLPVSNSDLEESRLGSSDSSRSGSPDTQRGASVPQSPFSYWSTPMRGHSCYTEYCKVDTDCCQAFQCVPKALTMINDMVLFGAQARLADQGSICSFSGA